MPRPVSSIAMAFLNQRTGTKPFITVGINWGAGINWYTSSIEGPGNCNIVEVGECRNQKRSDSMSNVASIGITFSDTDGAMKFVVDNINAEGAPATVFLSFAGATINDQIALIKGRVTAPISWDEASRKLSLNIESQNRSFELGYSSTKDDFEDISPEAQGVPWPMIFGSCAHVPALHVRKKTTGHLIFPMKFFKQPSYKVDQAQGNSPPNVRLYTDPDLFCYSQTPPEERQFYVDGGEAFPQDTLISVMINDVVFKGTMTGNLFAIDESNVPKSVDIKFANRESDEDNENYSVAWLADPKVSIVNQHCYLNAPAGKSWYNYCVKQIGTKCWFRFPFVSPVTGKQTLITATNKITDTYGISVNGMISDVAGVIQNQKLKMNGRRPQANKNPFGKVVELLKTMENSSNSWWQGNSDDEVRLWDQEDPDIYICSLVEMSEIKAVYGKRKVKTDDGKTKDMFAVIPEAYYEVQLRSNFKVAGNFATGLVFSKSLTDYDGQDWTGEVYVSGTSTVGPNSAKIIEWIFDNFSDLRTDGSFSGVADDLEDFEAHFTLFDKRDSIRVCQEIAFQSRCALVMDSTDVGIRFLAKNPPQIATFDESTTHLGSLHRAFTPNGDITTKLIASWTSTYKEQHRLTRASQRKTKEIQNILNSLVPSNRRTVSDTQYTVRTENVDKYGMRNREESCYIYSTEEGITAFLRFWGHRFANSWQLLEIQVPLIGVILQPFDAVALNYTDYSLLQTNLILGVVEDASFDFQNMAVKLLIWLPRVSGNNSVDPEAWTA